MIWNMQWIYRWSSHWKGEDERFKIIGSYFNCFNFQLPSIGRALHRYQLVERCTGIAEVMGSNPVRDYRGGLRQMGWCCFKSSVYMDRWLRQCRYKDKVGPLCVQTIILIIIIIIFKMMLVILIVMKEWAVANI